MGATGRSPAKGEASALHVLEIFQPQSGGVPAYIAAIVPGLLESGLRVTVACPPGTQAAQRLSELGAGVLPLAMTRAPHPVRDAIAVARLAAWCRAHGVDVVHGHSTKAGLLAALAGARAGLPSVYTPHGWSFERLVPLPLRGAYALYERRLVRSYHEIVVTVSASCRDAAERWRVAPRGAMRVVPTGLPPGPRPDRAEARKRLGLSNEQPLAVWVGRAGAQKRPQELVPIARRLAGEIKIAALCEGAQGTCLELQLGAAGVILPDLPCEPATLYAAADMLIHTSAWEDAPLVVLEAMAAGIPVVAYDVGGVKEQVCSGRTGYLVKPGDIRMMCECALSLARRPETRIRMGEAGRERAEKCFAYASMVEQLTATYAEVAVPARTLAAARTYDLSRPLVGGLVV